MVEGGVSDGSIRKRPALCDVTNVNGKRGISALSDVINVHGKRGLTPSLVNLTSKSGIGYGENRENMDLGVSKRVCQGLDKSVEVKSKSEVNEGAKKNELLLQLSKSKQLCGLENVASVGKPLQANALPGVPGIPHDVKKLPSMSKEDCHSEKGEVARQELSEKDTATSISVHVGDGQCGKDENSAINVTDGECKDDIEMSGTEDVKPTSSVMCDGQCGKDANFRPYVTYGKCKDDEVIITEVVETTSSVMGDGQCGKDENSLPNVTDGKCKDDKEVSNTEVVKANSSSVHTGDDGQCKKDENSLPNVTDGKCKDDKEVSNTGAVKTFVDLDPDTEELTISDVGNDDKGVDDDDVTSNKTSSTVGLEPSQWSNSKFYEPDRCTGFNGGGGGSNCATGLEMLKTCSCSFCLKAAHIWSDLHYQDTKGRISALKKSRKEVQILVEKSSIPADFVGVSNKSMKLEFELMDRWRSLFLHTEDILVRESSHLQSSLLTLKDLRDSCKADLEMITGDSSNKK